jgi:hypothetical protein
VACSLLFAAAGSEVEDAGIIDTFRGYSFVSAAGTVAVGADVEDDGSNC